MCLMTLVVQLLCGLACVVGWAACDFPRPADVGDDVGPGDAGVDSASDAGGDAGLGSRCARFGYPFSPWPTIGAVQTAVSDLNSDGNADLITTQRSTIGVLLGNGDGLFLPMVEYAVNVST